MKRRKNSPVELQSRIGNKQTGTDEIRSNIPNIKFGGVFFFFLDTAVEEKRKRVSGNLSLEIPFILPSYPSLTLQAQKTLLNLKVGITYISGDQYEKPAYGTLRKWLEKTSQIID